MVAFNWILFSIFLLTLSWGSTYLTYRYALKHLLDLPNERSAHSIPTPRGAGLAICISFFCGMFILLYFQLIPQSISLALIISSGLIATIGYLDDLYNLSARIRLMTHTASSLLFLGCLFFSLNLFQNPTNIYTLFLFLLYLIVFSFLMVYFLNLFNFMDGIDGIAGMQTLFLSLSFLIMSTNLEAADFHPSLFSLPATLGYVLALSSCGFLYFNWPCAKIFMGDIGSGFVGFVLAALSVLCIFINGMPAVQNDAFTFNTPIAFQTFILFLILSAAFWLDTTLTLLYRIRRGQSPLQAHSEHAYQHLSRYFNHLLTHPPIKTKIDKVSFFFLKSIGQKKAHQAVVLLYLLINVFWLLPFAYATQAQILPAWISFPLSILPLAIFFRLVGAGKERQSLTIS